MKMTKGEILAAYKDRPNAKRIQEIADENDVTANEIRKVLHDAGEDVAVFETRGPGRPKKEDAQSGKEKKADETLNDKKEDVEIKNEPALLQMPACEIPNAVLGLCRERVANINRQIQVYVEQVDLLNTERNELLEFIAKGENHEQNGVHREV